ncbi:hypothetical protein BJ170DRAFT_679209 [Xylariales sp. AK1849]|nr:hypothetical protein BJ170DRAFT_679209 [Xylariales sp. AK1849]
MADAALRQLVVHERRTDLEVLSRNGYKLQVAMGVLKDGRLDFNLIWQSKPLAPNIQVQWKPVYGLNWTTNVSGQGAALMLEGDWTQCNTEQAFDLDRAGEWNPSTSSPAPGSLTVGANQYSTSDVNNGVHIVVGIQGSGGQFQPIFVDPAVLSKGMGASYQPQQKVKWWFQQGGQTSSMVYEVQSISEVGDFSTPDAVTGTFSKTSSFSVAAGTWTTSTQ